MRPGPHPNSHLQGVGEEAGHLFTQLKVSSVINNLVPCPFSSAFVLHHPSAVGQRTLHNGFFLFWKGRFGGLKREMMFRLSRGSPEKVKVGAPPAVPRRPVQETGADCLRCPPRGTGSCWATAVFLSHPLRSHRYVLPSTRMEQMLAGRREGGSREQFWLPQCSGRRQRSTVPLSASLRDFLLSSCPSCCPVSWHSWAPHTQLHHHSHLPTASAFLQIPGHPQLLFLHNLLLTVLQVCMCPFVFHRKQRHCS